MSLLSAGIGYESLSFYGSFQPQHIEKLQITRAINDHAYLHISGVLSEEQEAACIGQDMEQEPYTVYEAYIHLNWRLLPIRIRWISR
ncbi:M1-339 [Paenibacillus polymyxa SC2]|uniref:M1-339 n=1 Tax=Paenibacillus polymyxa (strain SC2) TaxID=886882 RepID=E3EFR3_PAEPS|nr:M1-339 [Paenibacillus polymyxa SC2]